jgi:diguanylate cyclase (GGDEF)-like protein
MVKEYGVDLAFNSDEERKHALEKSKRDPLTQLFNRAYLEPYFNNIKNELNKETIKAVAIVYFDINSFKELNDRHGGHETGDEALRVVADRLRNVTRRDDGLFRVGGDEFVAILPINDMSSETIEDKKGRINDDLFIKVDDEKIPFSVSAGFEIIHKGDKRTAQQVLKVADDKMYEDKASGKSPHVFEIDKRHITQN